MALTSKERTQQSVDSSSDWANLPESLLFLILDKLFVSMHHVWFAAVCKEWCAVSKQYHQETNRCPQTLCPMLMIPSEYKPHNKLTLYDVFQRKDYSKIEFPVPCLEHVHDYNCLDLVSSFHGWWFRRGWSSHEAVYTATLENLFMNVAIPLPPFHVSLMQQDCWSRILLSADPILNPDDLMVLILNKDPLNKGVVPLAFTKAGQKFWTSYTERDGVCFEDAIFHRGQAYAIGVGGSVFSLELNDHSKLLDKLELAPPLGLDSDADRELTLELSNGQLLDVGYYSIGYYSNDFLSECSSDYYYSSDDEEEEEEELNTETAMVIHCRYPPEKIILAPSLGSKAYSEYLVESTKGELLHVQRLYRHKKFKVYKVVLDGKDGGSMVQHVEVNGIGEDAIFIDEHQHSFSVLASKIPGCQPNSIYFTRITRRREILICIYDLEAGTLTVDHQKTALYSWDKFIEPRFPSWAVPPVS
ncbi:hypothetical protein RchiOBHm_Chr4g0417201 [Rosa chinensis]|uniref:KIB1-4 beta-propeller domain-containing protein n=1 Tax=Rosa chinensis TaxID=74649 RepID=A0A2P6QX60_ROSCH|nr:hypothetical protein RchiOBHm_Chr4g0417201 [Rosa chinensis]